MTNKMYSPTARLLACLLALLCLFSIGTAGGVRAYAETYPPIDLTEPCSLKVYPAGSEAIQTDLKDAVFKVDAYQIAAAKEIPGIDSYDYTLTSAFTSLQTLLDAAREKKTDIPEGKSAAEQSREAWEALAQAAAALIQGGSGGTPTTVTKTAGQTSVDIPNLGAGLYLLVARTDDSNYWSGSAEEKDLASIAYSDGYNYLFAPQLVSLPYKSAEMVEPGEEDDPVMTSDNAPWSYDVTIFLKPEQQARHADLYIKKTLTDYKGSSSMLFVFYVDATVKKDGKDVNVYSKSCSVELSSNGIKYAIAKDIPVGTTVTISEGYPGAGCEPVSPTTLDAEGHPFWTGTMTAKGLDIGDEVLKIVPFVNKGKNNNNGGGIENTFAFTDSSTDSGYWEFIDQNKTPGSTEEPDVNTTGTSDVN